MSALTSRGERAAAPSIRRGGIAAFVSDTLAVFVRELRPVLRDPFSLVFSLVQPLVFLGLFGPLLVGSSPDSAELGLQWFVPGVLVMIALFGTAMTGSNLLFEIQTGSHERTLATPLNRSALLVGRSLKELVPLVVQALLIALVVIPFGFAVNPLGGLLGLLYLGVFGIGLGALSYTLGLASKGKEWLFWAVQQTLLFPLMILSGMLLPVESGPDWLQVVARFNPLTYLVNAQRALFSGDFGDPSVWQGGLAAIGVCLLGLWVGTRAMRRATV